MAIALSLGFQSDFFEIAKQIDIYTTLFKELNIYYVDEINPAALTKKTIDNTLQDFDPYTRFYDEQGVEDARIASSGAYGGIGALTRFEDGSLVVREVLRNSPAETNDIKPGDRIVNIDGIDLADFDETGAAALLNGTPGSTLEITKVRQGREETISMVRKKIDINPVPYYTMIDEEVGYMSFTAFNDRASREVLNAYKELKAEGMEKLIIDVRSNPGGLLNEAVHIVNFFIPRNQLVVSTRGKKEKWSDTYLTTRNPEDLEIPLAILIDDRSASASEILSGALQDYDRAVIIGQRSFGKGLVQRYRELSYGTQLKVTISKYYTPSGRCIQELDYSNRDEEGNVPKFSDYGRKSFKTQNGRTVFGGGGILPDVEVEQKETNKVTKSLLESDAIFNYSTRYFYANSSIGDPDGFRLNDSDFEDFKSYLDQHREQFLTPSETLFEEALSKATDEALDNGLGRNYKGLMDQLHREKIKAINSDKEVLLEELTEEIVKRYHYQEGVFRQKVAFDATIARAVSILNDPSGYQRVLNDN
jgi:carboxyl-terminal processing protease